MKTIIIIIIIIIKLLFTHLALFKKKKNAENAIPKRHLNGYFL